MSTMMELNMVNILLVEDNPGDVRLIQEVFEDGKIFNKLDVARDGQEAVNYLHQKGIYQNSRKPDLILLDLNLPKKSGTEVLSEIKSDEHLMRIPVIILTASKAEEDIARAYSNHANCYLTKPIDLNQFINVVQEIKSFWLSIVQLPTS
ncbi:MAG TPA: response regulator [Anaerolineales bacterium]|nr:response regulator [Anaerolineales bacterium]